MARRRDKGAEKRLATQRMERLLSLAAVEALAGRADLADRYAHRVRALAKRYQTGLPAGAKVRVCRRCSRHLLPGVTSRTRLRAGKVVTTCFACGNVRRRPVRGREDPTAHAPPKPVPRRTQAPSRSEESS